MTNTHFDKVTSTAKEVDSRWSNRDVVRFHYFNPNGAYKIHQKAYHHLMDAVDNVNIMGGALFAYGGDYHIKKMSNLVSKKRVSPFNATYHAEQLLELAQKIYEFLERNGISIKD